MFWMCALASAAFVETERAEKKATGSEGLGFGGCCAVGLGDCLPLPPIGRP